MKAQNLQSYCLDRHGSFRIAIVMKVETTQPAVRYGKRRSEFIIMFPSNQKAMKKIFLFILFYCLKHFALGRNDGQKSCEEMPQSIENC